MQLGITADFLIMTVRTCINILLANLFGIL